MKIIILLISLIVLNVFAKEEEKIMNYDSDTYIKDYSKLISTFGIVKSTPIELNSAKSIQETYLKTTDSLQFNYHSINYFLKLNENFKGFSPNGQLIYLIPELNNLFVEYNTTGNIVKRQLIENQYKEILKEKAKLVDYNYFDNTTYYSGVPLLGAYNFDFDNNEKTIIFETQKINYPAVYINCYKNGEMVGLFFSNGYTFDSIYLPTKASKTPIILKFPKEIRDKFEYTEKVFSENVVEKNLCTHKQKFEDLDKAYLYESLISDANNQFFVFFNIDKNYKENNYLVANVTHMGLFSYDNSDYLHMPYFLWEGKNYSKEKIEETIKNNLLNNNEIKKGFNNNFLKNNYTYVFDHENDMYFIQGINNGDRARMILNKTSLIVEYKIDYHEDYLELTLDKILKESANNFPLKMIITKTDDKSLSSTLSVYTQFIDRPHHFKNLKLNLKEGFLFDWKKNVEEK